MNRLKELRLNKKENGKVGVTQQEVADRIGVTKRTYIYWEKNERQIKPEKAQQLADYFGVSVGYLLGYEDNNSFVSSVVNEVDLLDPDDNTNNLNSDLKNKINLVKNSFNLLSGISFLFNSFQSVFADFLFGFPFVASKQISTLLLVHQPSPKNKPLPVLFCLTQTNATVL